MPRSTEEKARAIVSRLREAGHRAFFVGGCVRDRVMGIAPGDIDIATSARPEEVQRLFRRTLGVGAHFGVMVVLDGREQFQVATFRADGRYLDGRRPVSVTFCDERGDVQRRDFTINGLLYDPADDEVIDLVGGRDDIARKVIRCIGDAAARFEEDKLRIIRAVRFAARFDFAIDPATFEAARRLAPRIDQVSAERLREEFVKILTGPRPRRGMELLDAVGVLAVLLPEIVAFKGCAQPPEHHPEGDVWSHLLLMLDTLPAPCDEALALGVLLHDVGKPPTAQVIDGRIRFFDHQNVGAGMARAILRRLRFPNRTIDTVEFLVRRHMDFMHVGEMRESRLRRMLMAERFPTLLELHRIDCLASHGRLANHDLCVKKLKEMESERTAHQPAAEQPLINGGNLIAAGFQPGPLFREILNAVYDEQLERRVATREEALAFVAARFGDRRPAALS
ncbi:MAG: CCA tRNA nucleotidyltransferase [Planctomycetes bacterium]|nr:CCA tRNA nucleotidyltransferase [Planctomycetota bacterium]